MRLIHEEDLRPARPRLHQQRGILLHEGCPLGLIGFQQPLLRALVDEAQPVQVAQTRTAAESDTTAGLDELAHHLPIPVGQVDVDFCRGGLDRDFQADVGLSLKGGGAPGVLKGEGGGTILGEGGESAPDRVGITLQRCGDLVGRPPLR